ncbi:MAG: MarR family winged helix-turn-helix transcriptional regulator [Nakamurella sp.]
MTTPHGPWLSDDEQRVWRSYLQVTGMLTEHLDRELRRDAEIPHTYYQVLAMLSEAPGRSLRMTELAAAAWASTSRMSHAVDRLAEAGWVERQPAPDDKRGQIAVLTDAGYQKLTKAAPGHSAAVRAILFDPLSPQLLAAFGEICSSALGQLGANCDQP